MKQNQIIEQIKNTIRESEKYAMIGKSKRIAELAKTMPETIAKELVLANEMVNKDFSYIVKNIKEQFKDIDPRDFYEIQQDAVNDMRKEYQNRHDVVTQKIDELRKEVENNKMTNLKILLYEIERKTNGESDGQSNQE